MTFGTDRISVDVARAVLEAFGFPTFTLADPDALYVAREDGKWVHAPLRRAALAEFVGLDPINPVPGIDQPLPERTTQR